MYKQQLQLNWSLTHQMIEKCPTKQSYKTKQQLCGNC